MLYRLLVRFSGIKHKLLLVFVALLVAVTLLNAGLSAYLINQQGKAEASAQLSRELGVFKNNLQGLLDSLLSAARETALDSKNLSDLAILYNQRLKLSQQADSILENTFSLNKVSFLNRLQLTFQLTHLSSVAVYLEGDLSHYITRDEVGMTAHRDSGHVVLGSTQQDDGKFQLTQWRSWTEKPLAALISKNVAELNQLTISVDVSNPQVALLQVSVPIQGVPRESFNEIIVEKLAIASPQNLQQQNNAQQAVIIGMFVFSKIIDKAFLEELAARTGTLPAIYTLNGLQDKLLIGLGEPALTLPSLHDTETDWQTIEVGANSYYQRFDRWQAGEDTAPLILSMALSRENTLATIRNIVGGIILAAVFILLVGGASAYFLITRLVKPIKELTQSVSSMKLENEDSPESEEIEQTRLAALGHYLKNPIVPHSKDEISELTLAFNSMAGHLHRLIGNLETKVAERTRELTDSNQQLLIAEKAAEEDRRIAEAANRAKSVFLGNMSHELRTPLNAILGYADILHRNREATGSVLEGLDIIQHSGEHLLTLINDILDLAKVEAGKLELHPAPVNLPTFLKQIMSIIQARAEDKNLTLSYQSPSSLPLVVVMDETRLRQVLLNLLGNAVKFNDEGSVSLTVTPLEQDPQKGKEEARLHFQVSDSGVGIAPEQLERIFLPFEQTGEILKQEEGTGLGLAISRQIVQEMGGQLQVESELGQGSTFWFDLTLPVSASAPASVPVTVSEKDFGEKSSPSSAIVGYEGVRRKVLVVDDRLFNRQLLIDVLKPLGFELGAAADGQQAIDKALSWLPDAILMDLLMPVKSGYDAVREMRQRPELKDTLTIAISASVSKTDRRNSLEAGFDDFLPKPVQVEELFSVLGERLGLTWQYANTDRAAEAPMVAPAYAELRELYRLVEEGQIFEIQEAAVRLEAENEAYVPFAQQLLKMAKGFEVERIVEFINKFLKESENKEAG